MPRISCAKTNNRTLLEVRSGFKLLFRVMKELIDNHAF